MLKWELGGWFVKGNPVQLRAQEATETRVESVSQAVVFQRRAADKVEAMNTSLSAAHCFRLGNPRNICCFGQAKKSQQSNPSFQTSHKAADGTSLAVCTGHSHLLCFLPVAAGVKNEGCSQQPWGICILTTAPCLLYCSLQQLRRQAGTPSFWVGL